MDCRQAEELLAPYLLGALDSQEVDELDSHLDSCPACSLKLQEDDGTVSRLALGAPQLDPPRRIKRVLFARIEADLAQGTPPRPAGRPMRTRAAWRRAFAAPAAVAAASVLIVGLVVIGIWFNGRVDRVSRDNEALSGRLEVAIERESDVNRALTGQIAAVAERESDVNRALTGQIAAVAEREAQVVQMVRGQRELTYEALRMSATPGTSVNMLWGTGRVADARGMILYSKSGTRALLLVTNLPALPSDKVYQVWLIRGGQRYSAGVFTVDSTGYGQAIIIPVAPFAEFEGVGITIEPWGGSAGPTGTSVLKGDL